MWRASTRRGGRASSTTSALALAARFWPGPLTLVVPAAPGASVCDLARAGLDSVALRVPAHPLAHALLERVGAPGRGAVRQPLGPRQPDDRRARAGRARRPHRRGAGRRADAGRARIDDRRLPRRRRACCARAACRARRSRRRSGARSSGRRDEAGAPRAPGMLASHYAPRAQVRLDIDRVAPGDAVLLFGAFEPPGLAAAQAVLNLSRKRRPDRGRRSAVRASAHARRERRRKHRRRADPGAWPRRGDQRPPAPRRRRRLIAILRGISGEITPAAAMPRQSPATAGRRGGARRRRRRPARG